VSGGRAERGILPPLGRKLPLRCRYGAERRFGTLVLASRLDAGVSRSASLLAASLSDGGDIAAEPTNDRASRPALFSGGVLRYANFMQNKPASRFFLGCVLTAKLLPVPSGLVPSVMLPRFGPIGRLAMIPERRDVRQSGDVSERPIEIPRQAERGLAFSAGATNDFFRPPSLKRMNQARAAAAPKQRLVQW
jgi:hypothetical protein